MPRLAIQITNPMPPTPYSTWHSNTPDVVFGIFKAQFDALYERGAEKAVLMPLTVHDFIVGRPSRSKVLDDFITYAKQFDGVSFVTHDQVSAWWARELFRLARYYTGRNPPCSAHQALTSSVGCGPCGRDRALAGSRPRPRTIPAEPSRSSARTRSEWRPTFSAVPSRSSFRKAWVSRSSSRTGPVRNGIVATGAIAKAAPDGYTLLITSGAHIANAFVAKDIPFDVIKDFAPVTQLAGSYGLALITNLPVNSVAELIALAKSKPGQLTYATNGIGNITHIAGLLFDARTGTKMVPVQYNTPQLTTDVMAGTVDMTFFSIAAAAPLVNAGKLKALAVTGGRRAPSLPNTPTLQELGYADFDVTGYFGLLFPAQTPADRIDRIHREAIKALRPTS